MESYRAISYKRYSTNVGQMITALTSRAFSEIRVCRRRPHPRRKHLGSRTMRTLQIEQYKPIAKAGENVLLIQSCKKFNTIPRSTIFLEVFEIASENNSKGYHVFYMCTCIQNSTWEVATYYINEKVRSNKISAIVGMIY